MAIPAQPCLTIPEDDGHLEKQVSQSPLRMSFQVTALGTKLSTAAPWCHGRVSQWQLPTCVFFFFFFNGTQSGWCGTTEPQTRNVHIDQ